MGKFMRYCLLLILLVSVQGNPKADNPKRNATSDPPNKCQPTNIEVHASCAPETETSTDHQQTTKAEVHPFMTHGEYVISAITLIYAIFSIFTYFAIKRQAENAVLIERAWIDIELAVDSPTAYALNVTNHGRTVAKIKSWEIAPLAVPYQGTLGDRPKWPKEMLKKNNVNRLVTPTGKIFLDFIPVVDFFIEDWKLIVSMNKKAYFFVAVTYEDTAGQLRITKACCMYSLSHKFVDIPEMKKWT